jgi:Glycolipid 2-alpha-mannosyltransferase
MSPCRYPWVFLNDGDFSQEFRDVTTAAAAGGPTRYGKISAEHWGYPSWVPERKAAEARRQQVSRAAGFGCFAQCLLLQHAHHSACAAECELCCSRQTQIHSICCASLWLYHSHCQLTAVHTLLHICRCARGSCTAAGSRTTTCAATSAASSSCTRCWRTWTTTGGWSRTCTSTATWRTTPSATCTSSASHDHLGFMVCFLTPCVLQCVLQHRGASASVQIAG